MTDLPRNVTGTPRHRSSYFRFAQPKQHYWSGSAWLALGTGDSSARRPVALASDAEQAPHDFGWREFSSGARLPEWLGPV